MKKISIIALLATICSSCVMDCQFVLRGKIIDAETGEPISSAEVEFTNIRCTEYDSILQIKRNCIFLSDSLGNFEMISEKYRNCPDETGTIKIKKEGFQTLVYSWIEKSNNQVLQLKKLK